MGANDLAARLADVRARIARAAERSGRPAESIRLVGASKTVPADVLSEAVRLGLTDLGENRVQEAEEKAPLVAPRPRWHLIGHLQSNKARRAVALFDVVQSVDSPKLADALDRHAAELGKSLDVWVEVNVGGEAQKAGVAPADAEVLLAHVLALPGLVAKGFMTVGPLVERAEDARPAFRALAALAASARARWPDRGCDGLSMGMSGDFAVAIEEGSTVVRVGSALFGARR